MSSAEFVSTRGEAKEKSFGGIILEGRASDKGLYVPKSLPQLGQGALRHLAILPYTEQFVTVRSSFVGDDMDLETQRSIAERAYSVENFPNQENGIVTPVRRIGRTNIYIQDLSDGPTAAFKDMALQVVGKDMEFFLGQNGQMLPILGATSGDTGSAAEAALHDVKQTRLFMMSPEEGMSPFQRGQMGKYRSETIHPIAIRGTDFDALSAIERQIKEDPEFAHLGAVNSTNFARIASQTVYYMAGTLQLTEAEPDKKVNVVVPSGNFGNALAALYARTMGASIDKIIIATNENDVLDRLIQTGEYVKPESAHRTSSPSMDITVSSNLERVFLHIFEGDVEKVRRFMEDFETTGRATFESVGFSPDLMQQHGFMSGKSDHKTRIQSMRWVYNQNNRDIIDPHTADGITVARSLPDDGTPIIVMETAKAVKFDKAVFEANGYYPAREERFVGMEDHIEGGFIVFERGDAVQALKDYIRSHS